VELLILLRGTLQLDEKSTAVVGPTSLLSIPVARNEKTQFRAK